MQVADGDVTKKGPQELNLAQIVSEADIEALTRGRDGGAEFKKTALNAKDSDLLKQLLNVRVALMREKAISDELCDNLETTDREIREMHFQDTQQVQNELEESRKEFMREKAKFEEVKRRKLEINNKIEQFKLKFHEQRRQTKRHQELQAKIERDIKHVVEQCNYLEKENQHLKKMSENNQLIRLNLDEETTIARRNVNDLRSKVHELESRLISQL